MKQVKYEDWSQRFARERARKAVQWLNDNEGIMKIVFPIMNIITGLLILYLISKAFL